MRIAVVGGGITGLATAYELCRSVPEVDVVLFEAGKRLGGNIRTSSFAGRPVDEAADAFLARVPAGVELCRELGLDGALVAPATGAASVWLDGRLVPFPEGHVLGVPTDLGAAATVLSPAGVARAAEDLERDADSPTGADETIGALVRRRLGPEVLERLVGPLVGGINGGDADRLSVRATTPQLAAAADADPSLIRALRAQRAAATATGAPVFYAPRGGMGALIAALVEAIGAADIRLACTAEGLARDGRGWTVTTARGTERVDGVVVALPAPIAGRLLAPTAPAAAGSLVAIEYASVAIVAFAVDADAVSAPLDGSGFLVPSTAGLLLSACSSFTNKWPHLADGGTVILRASAGRAGDDRIASLDDDALVRGLLADLGTTIGLRGEPREVRVSRWPRSFPQYAPGHLDRVDAIDRDLAAGGPGLAVAGAGLRGLGVPACITQGRDAARRVLASLSG